MKFLVGALANAVVIAQLMLGSAPARAEPAMPPVPSGSSWPRVTVMADLGPHQHSAALRGTFGGRKLRYHAALSEMVVRDRQGRLAGTMFATSYTADVSAAAAMLRPVIFIFNGGPGGSSNTLMFGAMGPTRLQHFDVAARADAATPVVPNEDAVLDVADLVFLDAPETGFDRPLAGADPAAFRSNDGDSSAFTQTILRWLHDHDRVASPLYLAGESYGSVRAVLLARDLLAATPRVSLAGMVLISQALWYNGPDSASIKRVPDPVRAINALPDIAALAWYHGLIDNRTQTLQQAVGAAQDYALTGYAQAMLAGTRLPEPERVKVAERLAALTGLPAATWLDGGLRLENIRRQLLASRNRALDQFDGRETEPLQGVPSDEARDFKHMMAALTKASTTLSSETFHATGLPAYRSVVDNPFDFERTWTFVKAPAPGPDIVFREQMGANPKLRVMVTQGMFDTTATMGETDYLFSQIAAPPERMTFARFAGGHMLYADDDERRAFLNDIRAFVTGQPLAGRGFPQPTPGTVSSR